MRKTLFLSAALLALSAGAAGALPLSGSVNTSNFHLPGRPDPAQSNGPPSRWERVTPDYFRALAIPTAGVESLNASVAAAILLYEARRQRGPE